MVKSALSIRWIKIFVFLLCLEPLVELGWRALSEQLGANPVEFITHATGDWGLRFLLITLSITPARKLFGLSQLARFRRMLGLFSFFYACLHFLTYLWLDKFFDLHEILVDIVKRPFITIGFTSVMLMAPLAVTSTAGWIRRLGLRRWQLLHRLVYLCGIAAVIHYYWLVKSDIRLPLFYAAILSVLLTARLLGWRPRRTTPSTRLKLLSVTPQTIDTVTLRFALPNNMRLKAKPGQFFTFDWIVAGNKLPRSYSISSSPLRDEYVKITVKEQGAVSKFLNREARVGLTVQAHGPYGQFCFDEKRHRSVVFFAGGSGITPIMSMLRYIEETAPATEVTLFYSVRSDRDVIFERDLEKLQATLQRFRCVIVAERAGSRWRGLTRRVDRALIKQELGQVLNQTFFLCGPTGYMSSIKEILASLGVSAEQILVERFAIGTAATAATAEYIVHFARSGRKYQGSGTETLLVIAEKNGIEIPSSCRVGQCGSCATRVLDGEVEMEVEDGLDPALRARGYRLLCVGHARGMVLLDA